ncbi:hypothetical protein DRO33_06125 [Candidatus Bathyarchaeota archaeon]|nr:MAG: hypothetical protein DRO33_06125 [Candidatus Bathyarchaeota archaeon]
MPSPGLVGRISRFKVAISRLKSIRSMGRERYFSDPFVMDSTERNFQVAIEAVLDVGSFIVARKGGPVPSKYREIGPLLVDMGVLDRADGEIVSSLAGLRNILVHSYSEVDHEILLSLLDRVEELEHVMSEMLGYMERERIDP